MSVNNKIGFIQGRLSPIIDGKIQCFPWGYWQNEFFLAHQNDFHLVEWTLDQDRLYENPLMTEIGRKEIKELMLKFDIQIPSVTGDCFMQAPFYKEKTVELARQLFQDFKNVITAGGELEVRYIVVPLVDNGKLENEEQSEKLLKGLEELKPLLTQHAIKVVFESDFKPKELLRFIEKLDQAIFGINYDIGNSAALGFDPAEEIKTYGHRIMNVHVKDRMLNGGTVPLGTGNADFPRVFQLLKEINYTGNYILQTARAHEGNHTEVLCKYRDRVKAWI